MKDYIYVPPLRNAAVKHLRWAGAVRKMPKWALLRPYYSLAYLYPGLHPDCIGDWDSPKELLRIASEASRRASAAQLTEYELYPYQATKGAIARAPKAVRMEK